jgi:hypothetical protein
MPSAQSVINKVAKAISRVGPMCRTSYLRVTSVTGGDVLTGAGVVTATADTLFSPQPIFRQLGKREAMYLSPVATPVLQLVADDYKFTFPIGQATKQMFLASNVQIVLKDQNGYEGLKIIYIDTADFGGKNIAITVFARSVGFYPPPNLTHGFSLLLENGAYLLQEDGTSSFLE